MYTPTQWKNCVVTKRTEQLQKEKNTFNVDRQNHRQCNGIRLSLGEPESRFRVIQGLRGKEGLTTGSDSTVLVGLWGATLPKMRSNIKSHVTLDTH